MIDSIIEFTVCFLNLQKLFTENKEKLIVMALTSIIAHQGDQNEIAVHELEAQFHALRRLFATKAGFSTFIMLPEYVIQ